MTVPKITEGELDFDCPGAGKLCKTWYRLVGDLSSSDEIPLVTLHGGPGMGCDYVFPLEDLTAQYNVPVIMYDQLGCGRSTHLPEKKGDTAFWTIELFMKELENLLAKLNIKNYYLYGQSWGGMLGSVYASHHPKGLEKLIISNSPASMPLWLESCNKLKSQLPEDVQITLDKHEADGTTDSDEYDDAVMVWNKRHLCRANPFPEVLHQMFANLKKDNTVYHTMNGPSEFTVIGSLKNWSAIEECKKIEIPVLLINGRFDEGQNSCVAPFFNNIPRVRWVTMDQSSHLPMFEERERYMEIMGDFLTG